MNEEKTLLIEKCLSNPVLSVVASAIVRLPEVGGRVHISLTRLSQETGLTETRCRPTIEWFVRKGFLSSGADEPTRRGLHYRVDADLRSSLNGLPIKKFGELKEQIIRQVSAQHRNLPCAVFYYDNIRLFRDEYGTPLDLDLARFYKNLCVEHVGRLEKMDNSGYEHSDSQINLSNWAEGVRMKWINKPPAKICSCTECQADYERALTIWTNYSNYEKQEKRNIRNAMKEIC